MNPQGYSSNKANKKEELLFRQLCYRCFRPKKNCLCSDINAFDTRTRFVILMHPKEARKVKLGTGRLTHLCLKNSEILLGVDFTEDQRINRLIKDPVNYPVILYPGENSTDISEFPFPDSDADQKKILVFVVDASWTLAKKMLKLSTNLHDLPKIHFRPQGPSRYVIKQQPHPNCLSTIESVYFLLQELDKRGMEECREKHHSLLEFLDKICRLQLECTEDASLPGYRKNAVTPSGKKRWPDKSRYPGKRQRRSVCFD
ncbi:MAG: DTW domain-containing protein [Candidatus Aminicenantes bacterium]|nr:DTW domain-containing protein [Candidatus Aminicenantes bacterium]